MLHRELVLPNFHVILIHYPLGIFFLGLAMEILGAIFWRRHIARTVGRWLLLLGGLAMLPAALSGIYALRDVAAINNPTQEGNWAQTMATSPLSAEQWRHLSMHVWLMSIATVIVLAGIVTFLAASNRLRNRLYLVFLLLMLIGAGLMSTSAWFAGEAIYHDGAAIKKDLPEQTPTTEPTRGRQLLANMDVMFPPVQTHIVFAGFAAAFALAALGLSIRQITSIEPEPEVSEVESLVQSLAPPEPPPLLYPARFWLIAWVIFVLTALLGAYLLGRGIESFKLKDLWQTIAETSGGSAVTRRLAHVIAGSALIVLSLLLAIFARFAPRQKALLGIFALLLTIALAAQVWLGILLLYDGPVGTLLRFAGK